MWEHLKRVGKLIIAAFRVIVALYDAFKAFRDSLGEDEDE